MGSGTYCLVFCFPPWSYRRTAVGNGILPSTALRKRMESGIKPQRLRPLEPNNQNSVGVGVRAFVQPFSLPLSQAAGQRTGCCWSDGDSGRSMSEPVPNPAVVAKQPDLMLEMSASE